MKLHVHEFFRRLRAALAALRTPPTVTIAPRFVTIDELRQDGIDLRHLLAAKLGDLRADVRADVSVSAKRIGSSVVNLQQRLDQVELTTKHAMQALHDRIGMVVDRVARAEQRLVAVESSVRRKRRPSKKAKQ